MFLPEWPEKISKFRRSNFLHSSGCCVVVENYSPEKREKENWTYRSIETKTTQVSNQKENSVQAGPYQRDSHILNLFTNFLDHVLLKCKPISSKIRTTFEIRNFFYFFRRTGLLDFYLERSSTVTWKLQHHWHYWSNCSLTFSNQIVVFVDECREIKLFPLRWVKFLLSQRIILKNIRFLIFSCINKVLNRQWKISI